MRGTLELTGAAGSNQNGVAGCHRVRRRCTRYAIYNPYFDEFSVEIDLPVTSSARICLAIVSMMVSF